MFWGNFRFLSFYKLPFLLWIKTVCNCICIKIVECCVSKMPACKNYNQVYLWNNKNKFSAKALGAVSVISVLSVVPDPPLIAVTRSSRWTSCLNLCRFLYPAFWNNLLSFPFSHIAVKLSKAGHVVCCHRKTITAIAYTFWSCSA